MEIRFGVQEAPHRSLPVSAQRMVNCYLESAPPGSKTQAPVIAAYGISQFSSLSSLKGAKFINGVLYAQTATGLYSVSSAGTATLLGSLAVTGDAIIEGDGVNVVVTADSKSHIYDGTAIAQITDADFPTPAWMGYVDGYFPVIESGSGRFYINTTPFAPGAWDALDFATAEGAPDDLLWGIVEKRELILFGCETTEIWYNSGATFPFDRVANGFFETGIMSARAAGKIAEGVYFMGNDGIAYQLNGYTPSRISTHAVEQAVEGYTKDCRVLTWKESGHSMVGFKFPEGCWVYDLSTQLWHSRKTYGSDTWDVDFIVYGYSKYLTGGAAIGQLQADLFTEYGDVLRSQCTSAAVADRNNLISHDRLELIFETGNEGTVMLRFSDDGGRTWSNEKTASLGALGEYKKRVIFSRLGSSRDRVYEYAISDPYRRTLLSATLNEWG